MSSQGGTGIDQYVGATLAPLKQGDMRRNGSGCDHALMGILEPLCFDGFLLWPKSCISWTRVKAGRAATCGRRLLRLLQRATPQRAVEWGGP